MFIEISNNETLFKVYKKMAAPALLFGCESWALMKQDDRRVETAEMELLGRLHDIATFYGD